MICSMAISPNSQTNQLIWSGTYMGEFSVKSVYHVKKTYSCNLLVKLICLIVQQYVEEVLESQCTGGGNNVSLEGMQ